MLLLQDEVLGKAILVLLVLRNIAGIEGVSYLRRERIMESCPSVIAAGPTDPVSIV